MNRQFEIVIDQAIRNHRVLFTANADSMFDIVDILTLALPEYCTVYDPILGEAFTGKRGIEPEGIDITDEWEAGFCIRWNWESSGQELKMMDKAAIRSRGLETLQYILEAHGRYGRKSYPVHVLEDIGPSLWFEISGGMDHVKVRYCFDDSTR